MGAGVGYDHFGNREPLLRRRHTEYYMRGDESQAEQVVRGHGSVKSLSENDSILRVATRGPPISNALLPPTTHIVVSEQPGIFCSKPSTMTISAKSTPVTTAAIPVGCDPDPSDGTND